MTMLHYLIAVACYGVGAMVSIQDFWGGLGATLMGFGMITALKGVGDYLLAGWLIGSREFPKPADSPEKSE